MPMPGWAEAVRSSTGAFPDRPSPRRIPTLEGGTTSNGYQRQAASGTVTVHISHDVSLDLRGYWTGGRNGYSDNYNVPGTIYGGDYGLSKQWSLYAGLNVSAFDGLWKSRLAIMENHTDNESVEPMAVPSPDVCRRARAHPSLRISGRSGDFAGSRPCRRGRARGRAHGGRQSL
jgi:outer membrane cobalamin receptor